LAGVSPEAVVGTALVAARVLLMVKMSMKMKNDKKPLNSIRFLSLRNHLLYFSLFDVIFQKKF
jgi:hypothetical protein